MLYPLSYGGDGGSVLGAVGCFSRRIVGNSEAMSTADKAWIKVDKLAGMAKEKVGRATGNRRLQAEGRADRLNVSVRTAGEKLKDAVRGRSRSRRTVR